VNFGITVFLFLCSVSFFYGYLTYAGMLAEAPLHLWVFIPDCPLYVGLMLIIVMLNVRNELFRFVVSAGLAKYGLWTLMIFLLYPAYYFSPPMAFNTYVLFAGHILMALGAFVIVPKSPKFKIAALALAWFLLNDFMDYAVGTMPRFPSTHLGLVIPASIALSILSVLGLVLLNRLRDSPLFIWVRRSLVYEK
jgi:uncharacterized membrane protein YpjA